MVPTGSSIRTRTAISGTAARAGRVPRVEPATAPAAITCANLFRTARRPTRGVFIGCLPARPSPTLRPEQRSPPRLVPQRGTGSDGLAGDPGADAQEQLAAGDVEGPPVGA